MVIDNYPARFTSVLHAGSAMQGIAYVVMPDALAGQVSWATVQQLFRSP